MGATWLIYAGEAVFLISNQNIRIVCVVTLCDNKHIGAFLQQKLKLSVDPYALNEKSKMPYYERGGAIPPGIAVISSDIQLPEKTPIQTNL